MKTIPVSGQQSWQFSSDCVSAAITRAGGHLAPVRFRVGNRHVEPFAIAPWATEKLAKDTPGVLRSLRGDFFCAPFGGNEKPWRGEIHPPHGETASRPWRFEALEHENGRHTLRLSMQTTVRAARVDKEIELRDGHTAIYSRHTISGATGPMCLGHHATLKFPDPDGSGLISSSHILFGQVAPRPFESPHLRGYQSLATGAQFTRLDRVPSASGGYANLARYPARRGFEDLALIVHQSEPDFAWTAAAFPDQGYVWFALKDPRILRSTLFWLSNGGRHYPPWNGRHTGVLGMEDITAYFHYGIEESARANPISRRGYATCVQLSPHTPLTVPYIMGVAPIPKGSGPIRSIRRTPGGILLTPSHGRTIRARVDTSFLQSDTPTA